MQDSLTSVSMHSSRDYTSSYVICGFEGDVLVEKIAIMLGKPLQIIFNGQFKDTSSNIKFKLNDRAGLENKTACIIASTCKKNCKSINDVTMEVLLSINAAKLAGAKEINLYIPYLGYARQDKVSQPGEPMSAQAVLQLFDSMGAAKITVLDIHNDSIFSVLSKQACGINKFAMKEFANRFKEMRERSVPLDNLVVVAPDKGARGRAALFLEAMQNAGFEDIAFAYFDKSRDQSVKGEVQSMELREVKLPNEEAPITGEKAREAFRGKTAIVIDDMADTCGTLLTAISKYIVGTYQAKEAYAAITHGVLSGDALEKIARTVELTKMFVTDSIPLGDNVPLNLEVISCAPVFAEAIVADMDS